MQDDKIFHLEIDPSVGEGIKVATETISIIGVILDKITEIDQEAGGTTIGQVTGVVITPIIIGEVMQDHTTDKLHNGHLGTEVKVEVEMKIMVMIILESGVEIGIKGDERNQGLDLTQG